MGFNSHFDSSESGACAGGGLVEEDDGMRKMKGGGERMERIRGEGGKGKKKELKEVVVWEDKGLK